MHADEIRATTGQVAALVAEQCPAWAGLPVVAVAEEFEGTDHVLFRLGEELVARMPKMAYAADQAVSDARWLPALAEALPVRLPVPVYVGTPGAGFPWPWSVVGWINGVTPPRLGSDDVPLALELAAVARALHGVDAGEGPAKPPGSRGSSLAHVAEGVSQAVARLAGADDGFDPDDALRAWELCLTAPEWRGPPVWIHGDLQPGNLVVRDGRLVGVIDWGALGLGDPAPDLAAAWWTFTGAARSAYRTALPYDDATWLRACGWALAPSLTGIDYYRHSFPRMAEHGRRTVRAVIAELL